MQSVLHQMRAPHTQHAHVRVGGRDWAVLGPRQLRVCTDSKARACCVCVCVPWVGRLDHSLLYQKKGAQ